ncbi:baseplate J/gp47 family protein [Brevibacillus sp. MER 51]|uniref:baseplate J/gp47 family protein n=1 Tax=Brevibacillus sp. MER 51 TaxID=2939560 RepID=UPI00203CBB5D|nr:baseplate J/gp47 family protein [Brevibacillus sp. MER 51]MCM3144380.1 baseplate J/gp47 family protein [Brevibacillus sp. MER 51]
MATIEKPEMPILRETPDQIYQRMANRMALVAQERGETPPATDEGEIYYDLGYPIAEEISDQQQLFEYGFLQRFLPWADGEFLDANGGFFGLPRKTGESDDAYRLRLIDRARSEEGDGRRADYERWARNIEGVGAAVAVEKTRHDNSIDVYITDLSGQPATAELAQLVRTKLEDKRRALHDLQVLPANVYPVTIAVKLVLRPDAEFEKVKDQITTQIKTYLKGRSQIVYQQIGALFFVDGVIDFTGYTLNGAELNLTVPVDSVSTLTMAVTT